MKKYLIFYLIIFFASCNTTEDKIEGGWLIDRVYINDTPVIYDLLNNSFDLYSDNTCTLPPIEIKDRNTEVEKGKWRIYKKADKCYLQIETKNRIFNRTFIILDFKQVKNKISGGLIDKMILTADSLKMECTKVPY